MENSTTPKQRYDARMAFKRLTQDQNWKGDELVISEYIFELAERTVSALEKLAKSAPARKAEKVD